MGLKSELVDLSDEVWQRTRARVEGLTDEEYLWEPADGCWTIRQRPDGSWMADWPLPRPEPEPFTTLAWTGFNTSSRQYEATRIASTNTSRIAETGTWDETSHRFELKASYPLAGETWTQRTVIQPTSPNTMVADSYLSFGTVPEWKAVQIKYTRRPK